jgi:hypothetical protein
MLAIQIFLYLLVYTFGCLCLGTFLNRLFFLRKDPAGQSAPLTILASNFILGYGFLAQVWIIVALLGWFSPEVIFGVVVSCILSGALLLRPIFIRFLLQISKIWNEFKTETWGWKMIYGLTVLACLSGLFSIGREITWDGIVVYFAYPKLFATVQMLKIVPGLEEYQKMGFQGEMHFAALMSLGSPDAAKLFTWPVVLSGAIILLAICAQTGLKRRGQWIALAIFFTSTGVTNLIGDGKTDLFAVSLGLAAFYWVLNSNLPLTGLFTGFALVAKFPFILNLLPAIALLFLWRQAQEFKGWKDRDSRFKWVTSIGQKILVMSAWALPAIILHLIKNMVLFRMLSFPYSSMLNVAIGFDTTHWAFPAQLVYKFLFSFPFSVTYGNYVPGQYGDLSPLVLAFLPLVLLLPRKRNWFNNPLAVISIIAFSGMLIYAIIAAPSIWQIRYYLVVLLLFIPLAARGAEYITVNGRIRWLAWGVMICLFVILCGHEFFSFSGEPQSVYDYLRGKVSSCDLGKNWSPIAFCYFQADLNREAPMGARLYASFSYPQYWLRSDLMQCSYDPTLEPIPFSSPNEAWQILYQRDFSYLYLNATRGVDKAFLANQPSWAQLIPIYKYYQFVLYQVQYKNSPFKKNVTCARTGPLTWDVVKVSSTP